ncbi:MAG: hypothetical protein EBU08_21040, partial [Micrococcales bacterium]|nr:hypothetical protein [Micrococcales bacterium]
WFDAVVAGDVWVADLMLSGGSGSLYARTIDAAGNLTFKKSDGTATSTFGQAQALGYTLDTTKPTAAPTLATTVVNTNNDANLGAGEMVTINFSKAVDVDTLLMGNKFASGALTVSDEAKLGANYTVSASSAGLATSFTITLAAGLSLNHDSTLTFSKTKIVDAAGNPSATNVTFTVPSDIVSPANDSIQHISTSTSASAAYVAGEVVRLVFNEPVKVANITFGNMVIAGNHSFGTGATISAVDTTTVGGVAYATTYDVMVGASPSVVATDTVTFVKANVVDRSGNIGNVDSVFTLPTTTTLKLTSGTANLSGLTLSAAVDTIDLNGQVATLKVAQATLNLIANSGSVSLKDVAANFADADGSGLSATVSGSRTVEITTAATIAQLSVIGGGTTGSISYTALSDSQSNLWNGTTVSAYVTS